MVGESLGMGGAGEVYRVLDESSNAFAAKVLSAGIQSIKLKRFQNELMFGLREDHPNLIKVLDFGRTKSDRPFYVMPLASTTLRKKMVGNSSIEDRLSMFVQLLDGVEAAHMRGVIHRDLKPENILIDAGTVKVADFGIAHFEEELLHTLVETRDGERLANFEYAAPEQRRANTPCDLRVDIYALGLILTELFTAEVPHGTGAKTIASVVEDYAYLDAVATKMRQQNPFDRYSSIREIKGELIGRKMLLVEQQKLDAARKAVIKESQIDDPLVIDPPTIQNVVFTGSGLTITLSRSVHHDWIDTFTNMPVGGLMGYGPEYHNFRENIVHIAVPERLAQQVLDQFKHYLETATKKYADEVARREKRRIQEERNTQMARLEAEEARLRVQQSLRW